MTSPLLRCSADIPSLDGSPGRPCGGDPNRAYLIGSPPDVGGPHLVCLRCPSCAGPTFGVPYRGSFCRALPLEEALVLLVMSS